MIRTNIAMVAAAVATVAVGLAQSPVVDSVGAGSTIAIRPLAHATLQIAHGRHVILVDPALDGALPPPPTPPGAPAPPPPPPPLPGTLRTARYQGLPSATLILVTHLDEDHFAEDAVAAISTAATRIVGPATLQKRIPRAMAIANGARRTIDGVVIEAVPMYNAQRGPRPDAVFHRKGSGNGYVVTLEGTRIYVAGDTECVPEVRGLSKIDVAFLPMNVPFTMTPAEAAECARSIKPSVVYPYHYAGQDARVFAAALRGTGIDVRLRNWYPLIPRPR
jgi:L-ascorbate metabolism protein UlaG (beta-lactamase superfamily)